ncbi:hypothetical protein AA313_de0206081 [Arthrobotrys entomopaga]|nr:hypothetical protein AA313_de0206081 [Arthrobotrys entomopaga]
MAKLSLRKEVQHCPESKILANGSPRPSAPSALKPSRWSYTLSSWFPELFCCAIGITAIFCNPKSAPLSYNMKLKKLTTAAQVIILGRADGKPPTNIAYYVTLNTFIQFITTIAKYTFIVPLISVSSQLKWLWFTKRDQPLADFPLHDDAGMGGLDSVKMFFSVRILLKSPIAWFAATVALSGLVTSPVTQQTISFILDRQILTNGTAYVSRATNISWSDASGLDSAIVQQEELLASQAYLAAAYLAPNDTVPEVEPVCSSGDCDWPLYGSLGVCAEVVNISASTNKSLVDVLVGTFVQQLTQTTYGKVFESTAQDLPVYAAALIPFPQAATRAEFKETQFDTVISQVFISHFNGPVILSRNADIAKIQLIGVSMYICTKSFSTTVRGGVHETVQVASAADILSRSTSESINAAWNGVLMYDASEICKQDGRLGQTITLAGPAALSHESYTMDVCTANFLSELYFIGTTGAILLGLDREVGASIGQISLALGTALYGGFVSPSMADPGIPDPETQFENIKSMMENIAKGLTNRYVF